MREEENAFITRVCSLLLCEGSVKGSQLPLSKEPACSFDRSSIQTDLFLTNREPGLRQFPRPSEQLKHSFLSKTHLQVCLVMHSALLWDRCLCYSGRNNKNHGCAPPPSLTKCCQLKARLSFSMELSHSPCQTLTLVTKLKHV